MVRPLVSSCAVVCSLLYAFLQTEVEERDIASWFIKDAENNKDNKEYQKWLSGDTATVVVAGRYSATCKSPNQV